MRGPGGGGRASDCKNTQCTDRLHAQAVGRHVPVIYPSAA
ncbi:UNVERIFIED_ORG: hypothetical protein ABIC48_005119 [Burkholderia territorii]